MAESYAPGASATAVAVRHGLHRNQILTWRRQLHNSAALIESAMRGLVPMELPSPAATGAASVGVSSRIEVIGAGLTIRIRTGFDTGDLRRVLSIVRELT